MFSAQCFVFCLFSRWSSNNQGEFYVNPRGDLQSDCYSSHSILKYIFEFQHKQYLVTVDHYSDFHELDQLINTQSTTIIVLTKAHFAHHGIPVGFLTDNGPKAKEV